MVINPRPFTEAFRVNRLSATTFEVSSLSLLPPDLQRRYAQDLDPVYMARHLK